MTDQALDEAFEERRQQVETYARTWWALPDEPQRTFLRSNPEVRPVLLALTAADAQVNTIYTYSRDRGLT